jgi:hypothetical protein
MKPYYTPVDRFVRKSCGADFKVQGNFKLDDVVGPGICTKQGFEGQPGQETTQYQVDAVRKIGCSSLLFLVRVLQIVIAWSSYERQLEMVYDSRPSLLPV